MARPAHSGTSGGSTSQAHPNPKILIAETINTYRNNNNNSLESTVLSTHSEEVSGDSKPSPGCPLLSHPGGQAHRSHVHSPPSLFTKQLWRLILGTFPDKGRSPGLLTAFLFQTSPGFASSQTSTAKLLGSTWPQVIPTTLVTNLDLVMRGCPWWFVFRKRKSCAPLATDRAGTSQLKGARVPIGSKPLVRTN